MSSNYEMMYILRPDLSEDQVREAVEKYKNYLSENGAEDLQVQVKGKRRLAYVVKKHLDGIYVQMNFQADGSQIAPLERMMRLSEEVIRYLSLKLNKRSLKAAKLAEEQPESTAEEVEA
jgi:small subunit ribosomal protein S6